MAQKRPRGRPSGYHTKFEQIAYRMALLGCTDAQMSVAFEVSESTFNLWKLKHPEFSESLKRGRAGADGQVARSLFERATGYSHDDVHIALCAGQPVITNVVKHYPPDTIACIFWLKNRRPDLWRDVQRHEHTGKDGEHIQVEHMSVEELRRDMIQRGELSPQGRLIQN